MSVLSTLFGGQKTQQRQEPQPSNGQPPAPNPHVQGNNTIPHGNEPAANPSPATQQTQSPNEAYKDLWSNVNQPTNAAPNFKLDPAQLATVTGKMDFAKSVSREDLGKITQGGEGAVEALVNVLNNFGREVFGASAQFSSHMTESGYQSASKVIDNGLPGAIKRQLTEQHLYQNNPKLKDPALQPLVGALQAQFTAKHPNASPQEINELVNDYMGTVVAGAFAKEDPNAAAAAKAKAQPDFSGFL